ncbi:Sulfotransferase family protein [Streptosporangium subroseum]|uniref:Sulfotransferase family protein n=1 Tax=Streptosporangium subroseum TaxID=106412 RepID=A0A239LCU4_9ACTN|nr:sulfotransferase [Streptosporangium subroseum]SNT28125.1 Sulfotransferase family protein [Streptosporangium subroseum]
MRPPPHILVVNGIKVRQPVFVLAAPHSGADLLARALKRSPGFHVTMGRPAVAHVVYAFARRPSIASRGMGATRVLRDAMAEAWQIVPGACQECPEPCREAGGVTGAGPCVASNTVARFGDASPDLLYSASVLLQAFPDARFVQLIRDGRDVIADMLADPAALSWFKPVMLSDETEFPNPFLGLNSGEHSERWKAMPTAGKCALRWRSAVRLSASLHHELPREQLLTLRYEDLVSSPADAAEGLSTFLGTRISKVALYGRSVPKVGAWRTRLRGEDAELVAKVAREELLRLGYVSAS